MIDIKQIQNLVFYSTFYYERIRNLKKYNLNIPRNSINIFHKDITPELVEKAHQNNMAVMPWFDIEEKNEDENEMLNLF